MNIPGTQPRSIEQISYYRNQSRKEKKPEDEFQEILHYMVNDDVGNIA